MSKIWPINIDRISFFMCQVLKWSLVVNRPLPWIKVAHSLTLIEAKKKISLARLSNDSVRRCRPNRMLQIFFIYSRFQTICSHRRKNAGEFVCLQCERRSKLKTFQSCPGSLESWVNSMRATVDTSFPLKMEIFNILHIFDLLRKKLSNRIIVKVFDVIPSDECRNSTTLNFGVTAHASAKLVLSTWNKNWSGTATTLIDIAQKRASRHQTNYEMNADWNRRKIPDLLHESNL